MELLDVANFIRSLDFENYKLDDSLLNFLSELKIVDKKEGNKFSKGENFGKYDLLSINFNYTISYTENGYSRSFKCMFLNMKDGVNKIDITYDLTPIKIFRLKTFKRLLHNGEVIYGKCNLIKRDSSHITFSMLFDPPATLGEIFTIGYYVYTQDKTDEGFELFQFFFPAFNGDINIYLPYNVKKAEVRYADIFLKKPVILGNVKEVTRLNVNKNVISLSLEKLKYGYIAVTWEK